MSRRDRLHYLSRLAEAVLEQRAAYTRLKAHFTRVNLSPDEAETLINQFVAKTRAVSLVAKEHFDKD